MRLGITALMLGLSLLGTGVTRATEPKTFEKSEIRIDIPVQLSEARVVFNLDHTVFNGDEPIGLQFMKTMVENLQSSSTKWQIIAIFHGPNGYIALNDARYDRVRRWNRGNPYKDEIEALRKAGVQIELCAETMRLDGWLNDDILPGIKINSGANFRLIQLMQQGFVEIHP